ncbi:HAD family hydrolase [Hahella sp. HN01]|nr:HAD family hydrolase [Hahella sp. HN01]
MIPSGLRLMNLSGVKGFIFDLDGTLVDSRLDFDAMRRELGFPEGKPILEHLETLDDPDAVARAWAVVEAHEIAGARAATWMPGAKELLMSLRELDIPVAIMTRNMREATRIAIEALGIPVELALTREDCKPKPHPEGLLRIAETWGLACGELIYVGDYIFDLQAARNANMIACLYLNERNHIYQEHADCVIRAFDELSPHR